jgi:hypothetical protein
MITVLLREDGDGEERNEEKHIKSTTKHSAPRAARYKRRRSLLALHPQVSRRETNQFPHLGPLNDFCKKFQKIANLPYFQFLIITEMP